MQMHPGHQHSIMVVGAVTTATARAAICLLMVTFEYEGLSGNGGLFSALTGSSDVWILGIFPGRLAALTCYCVLSTQLVLSDIIKLERNLLKAMDCKKLSTFFFLPSVLRVLLLTWARRAEVYVCTVSSSDAAFPCSGFSHCSWGLCGSTPGGLWPELIRLSLALKYLNDSGILALAVARVSQLWTLYF